ncbi:hypothetical protein CBF23_006545 [Marinomonas agarivorans]|nr:hypothetical protein CBF23_006545 [Marinomonas agarivorans]
MIVRLIVFLLIFTLLWYLVKRILTLLDKTTQKTRPPHQGNTSFDADVEQMVICKKCGVYTPRNHAIKANETDFYCSQEHYDQRKK